MLTKSSSDTGLTSNHGQSMLRSHNQRGDDTQPCCPGEEIRGLATFLALSAVWKLRSLQASEVWQDIRVLFKRNSKKKLHK